jgi:hypothetical protein
MSIDRFLYPRLTGARFDGHAIPLEFLKDLAVLEELIIEVAKAKWIDDHAGRKRSPRGWTDGIEFKLTAVEDGSAIPIISLIIAANALFPPESQHYFEQARESVISAIGAAEQNQSVTDHLPEKTLTYFDKIGRSLRDGEAMEFTTPQRQAPAKLTKETRRRLILASDTVKELTEEISVRGTIPDADQEKLTFEARLMDGQRVPGNIPPQHLDTIRDAWIGFPTGTRVLLQGVGKFSRHERLLGFESIEHVSILDALDLSARLDELRPLKNGWLEGRGIAPSQEGLDWLSLAFAQHYPEDLRLPFLYPTEDGGVRAEWSLEPHEASLDISLANHTAEWHVLNMETDAEDSNTLNLNEADDWKWLIEKIQEMNGGEQ